MDSKEILLEVFFNNGHVDHYIVDNYFYRTRIVPWFKNIAKVEGDAMVLPDTNGFETMASDAIVLPDVNGIETMVSRNNVCMIKSIEDEQEIAYYKKLSNKYKESKNVKL